MVSVDDPGVEKILHGLPDAKRQDAIDLMNKVVESKGVADAQKREKMQAKAVVDGAKILNPAMGLKVSQNEQLSEAVMQAIMNPADAEAQRYGQIAEQKIAQRDPSGQVQIGLLKFLQGEAAKLQEQQQYDAANPARVTTEQYGKWDVWYNKGGREYFTRGVCNRATEGLGDSYIVVSMNEMYD